MAAALSSLGNAVASITNADAPITGIDRHCAFCLDLVPAKKVLRCGKCQRRAYCSKQCQERDWNVKAKKEDTVHAQLGQGHKNWCGLAAGEEDLDWKVTEIEGKGLGLVALRDIPAGFRIMVEAGQPTPFSHPKTSELMPLSNKDAEGNWRVANETELKAKFDLNCVGSSDGDEEEWEEGVLCMRVARANHNCFPNAELIDSDLKVKILYAVRDISAGEEIAVSYIDFTTPACCVSGLNAKERHAKLQSKWGFDCPSDSPCRDEEVKKRIAMATQLLEQIVVHGKSLRTIDKALAGVNKLLQFADSLGWTRMEKVKILNTGFQIAVTSRATLKVAKVYISKFCELVEPINHPNEGFVKEYLGYKEDIRRHPAYLRMDNRGNQDQEGYGGGCVHKPTLRTSSDDLPPGGCEFV